MTKQEIKKLDKIWSEKVKESADYRCEVCGKTNDMCQLHSHHFVGRRIHSLRWVLENGFCLCASHHTLGKQSAHENPVWFIDFAKRKRGKDWYKKIVEMSNQINKKTFNENLEILK